MKVSNYAVTDSGHTIISNELASPYLNLLVEFKNHEFKCNIDSMDSPIYTYMPKVHPKSGILRSLWYLGHIC